MVDGSLLLEGKQEGNWEPGLGSPGPETLPNGKEERTVKEFSHN